MSEKYMRLYRGEERMNKKEKRQRKPRAPLSNEVRGTNLKLPIATNVAIRSAAIRAGKTMKQYIADFLEENLEVIGSR